MAERPIFVPAPDAPELVKEIFCQLEWNPGFAPIQKKKNIAALHAAAAKRGFSPLLEVSTKSESPLGQYLSAFNLKIHTSKVGDIPMELAFQGGKVFEHGGPYVDLYKSTEVKDARRDARLQNSGRLVGFKFEDISFPPEPKTVFYDWLYINAIFPSRKQFSALREYAGYTDIEFNPHRSVNCQARSCALFVTLLSKNLLEKAVASSDSFIQTLTDSNYRPNLLEAPHPSQGGHRSMKVYCDTNALFHNISRHKEEPNAQRELDALEQLLQRRQAGTPTMFRSRVDLRELEETKDQSQREKLRLDYESLEQIPNDEKHYASNVQTDQHGGTIANPLVSDVQNESICRELLEGGLERRDAQHITQALCNDCDVFLTRDVDTIIRPHRKWLETQFPSLKIRLPTELLEELLGRMF
jgi:hypothetical protein